MIFQYQIKDDSQLKGGLLKDMKTRETFLIISHQQRGVIIMPNKCQQMSGHVSGSVDVLIPTGRGSRLTRQGDRPSNYPAAVCQPSVPNVVTVKHCYDIGRRTWALYEIFSQYQYRMVFLVKLQVLVFIILFKLRLGINSQKGLATHHH